MNQSGLLPEIEADPNPIPASPDHGAARPTLPGYLPTLDGWRALAILAVMIHHDRGPLFGRSGLVPIPWLGWILEQGLYGVDVFFGISGFLICTRLLVEYRTAGRISLEGFYIRRGFRIMPPYLLYLAVMAALAAFGILDISRWNLVSCLLFFRNYLPVSWAGADGSFTGHFWSLAVEEHFYILWPTLLILLLRTRKAAWAAFGTGMAITAWRGLDARYGLFARWTGLSIGNLWRSDTRLDGLVFGCWVALLLDSPGWRDRLTRALKPAVWFSLVVLFLAVIYSPRRFPAYRLWVSLIIPFLLAGTVLRPMDRVGRFLEWKPLRWIGRISYSLYLWQQLFLHRMPGQAPFGLLEKFPLNWISVFACALFSYHFVETPLISLGRRLSRRPRTQEKAT